MKKLILLALDLCLSGLCAVSAQSWGMFKSERFPQMATLHYEAIRADKDLIDDPGCVPVLYIFDEKEQSSNGWRMYGWINPESSQEITSGRAVPMHIVMPFDHHPDDSLYEHFLVEEFIPHIEARLGVRPDGSSRRAIAGVSHGGVRAMRIAARYSDMFAAACSMSAPLDESILRLLEASISSDRMPYYWIDCGADDPALPGNRALHEFMADRGIEHQFWVFPGGHDWSYWRVGLRTIMQFISRDVFPPRQTQTDPPR